MLKPNIRFFNFLMLTYPSSTVNALGKANAIMYSFIFTWDSLRYFIVALHGPSIHLTVFDLNSTKRNCHIPIDYESKDRKGFF